MNNISMTAKFKRAWRGTCGIAAHLLLAIGMAVAIPAIAMPAIAMPSISASWSIDQLMQSLAQAKPGRAHFVETKFISMLDRPLMSSGELSYQPPDRLEKQTIKPRLETMVVEGDRVRLERGAQQHILQLQDYPELSGLIDSIRGTLAGDRKMLERSFHLALEGPAERWTLTLRPAEAKMATLVHLVRINGVLAELRSIEVIQTDGDRSLMTIQPATQSMTKPQTQSATQSTTQTPPQTLERR